MTIVLGHAGDRPPDPELLRAFAREAESAGGEVILVAAGNAAGARRAAGGIPALRLVEAPRGALVPSLWSLGIRSCRSPFVALSVAAMEPDPGWLAGALERLGDGSRAAVGGAIENVPASSAIHWAVYFARYSGYMLPFREHDAPDLPGDNAVYRRDAFRCAEALVARAFWEPEIHAVMRASGWTLRMDPGLVVRHHPSFGARAFTEQRFRHGREHGASRAAGRGLAARLGAAATAPLVPLVLYGRIIRRVLDRRRHLGRLAVATPHLAFFLTAWAIGEAVGALLGAEPEPVNT